MITTMDKFLVESFAVLAIIMILLIVFLKGKRFKYTLSIIPLGFLPAANILGWFLGLKVFKLEELLAQKIVIGAEVVALVAACIMFTLFSKSFSKSGNRKIYLFSTCGFSLILALIYILNLI